MSDERIEELNQDVLGDPSQVRLASSFYRFSSYLESIVSHRVSVFFQNGQFWSYRQSKSKGLKKGSKLFQVTKGFTVSEVKQQSVRVRSNDVLSTVMFAESRKVWYFKIIFPDAHEFKAGFGSQEKAHQFAASIMEYVNTKAPEASLHKTRIPTSDDERDDLSQPTDSPKKIQGQKSGMFGRASVSRKKQKQLDMRQESKQEDEPIKAQKGQSQETGGEDDEFDECESVDFLDNVSLPDKDDLNDINLFRSLKQHKVLNGVTIYKELDTMSEQMSKNMKHGSPDVFVVATPIRVAPKECFKTFIYRRDLSDEYNYANQWIQQHVLKRRSKKEEPEIVYLLIEPPLALEGKGFTPRYTVAYQNFTLGDDDEYIVRYTSVEKEIEGQLEFPEVHKKDFVAVKLNMVFNVSPITNNIRSQNDMFLSTNEQNKSEKNFVLANQECYLSLVLSVETFGGFFEYKKFLGAYVSELEQIWIEDLLMSVVYLRNKLEQRRFKIARQIINKTQPTFEQHGMKTRFTSFNQKTRMESTRQLPDKSPMQNTEIKEEGNANDTSAADQFAQDVDEDTVVYSRIPAKHFESPGFVSFRVRGKTYLEDKKKIPAGYPIFDLVGLELIKTDKATDHYARFIPWIQQNKQKRFLFIVSLTIPLNGKILGFVVAFGSNIDFSNLDDDEDEGLSPVDLCMARFLDGDDEASHQRRCRKLKLIPSIPEGSWFIKNIVGQTPVILGTKLKSTFHRGPGYIESTIDVSTNATAANVTNIVSGAARSIVMDMAILLEGQTADELPEAILGIVRLKNLDWNQAYPIDITKPISNEPRVQWLQQFNMGRSSGFGGQSVGNETQSPNDPDMSFKVSGGDIDKESQKVPKESNQNHNQN